MHLYGYDSSHSGAKSHAYAQPMNALMPMINVTWGGAVYSASMPMKLQAFAFPKFARALMDDGVKIEVHGKGLLPAIWSVPPASEQEKYSLMWMTDDYRVIAPGEHDVAQFLDVVKPDSSVIDFGCGTGRAAMALHEAGLSVLCIDFTDNCRDKACMGLEFLQWDLTNPIPAWAEFGFCTDVMEHIPTADVETVIRNIMASARRVFFKIARYDDLSGPALIGSPLHLTVQPHEWWLERFSEYQVQWQEEGEMTSCFYIIRKDP
jgi:SAM-dependent methyltransferase